MMFEFEFFALYAIRQMCCLVKLRLILVSEILVHNFTMGDDHHCLPARRTAFV